MASLHKRPRTPYWHASFLGPDGRWMFRSTKQEDRDTAMAVALEFERAAKMARRGELVEAQAREVIGDIMKRANTGERLQSASIKSHFADWLASKCARKADKTGERYEGVVRNFMAALGTRQDMPLTALVTRDIERFLTQRLESGVSPRTGVLDVKIIRTCLNHARRQGLIPTNPAEAVELPESKGIERGTFTPAEVGQLVAAARGEWKTLIMLGYFCGARLGDCCRIKWDDLDLAKQSLTYVQSKTGTKVTCPLHPELLAYLEGLAGTDTADKFISPHMADLKSGGRHGLSEGFKRIVVDAGLSLQTVEGRGIRNISRRTFHALRHSFASGLANKDVSPELRMKLTGHKSSDVHRGYTHHEFQNLKDAIGKLPGILPSIGEK